ncbi:TonB-dependent receptor domain-containing protein [Paludibacterium yongneupense]|uniref:TonB-dependent receptor domain-containing protein n=1 Tax=Paludibacterium yongneupense TaxID=400061 RepID=UPI0003F9E89B|nr:TonB-dependent receptor [Paludibacterium yongneupense]
MFIFKPLAGLCALACASAAVADSLPQFKADDIIVTATRMAEPITNTLSDVTVVTREEIEQAGATSLSQLLARQPGVEIAAYGGPGQGVGISLRGANTNHTVVLLDGVRIVSATTNTTSLQYLPLDQIERIEIVRGPVSSVYGADAIGGVIQIFTREGRSAAQWSASLGMGDHGTLKSALSAAGKIDATAYSVTVSSENSDGYPATAPNNAYGYNSQADAYNDQAYSVNVTQTLAPGHDLSLRLFQSFARNDYAGSSTEQDQEKVRLSGQTLESRNRLSEVWSSSLRFARTEDLQNNFNKADMTTSIGLYQTTQNEWTWENTFKTSFGTVLAGVSDTEQYVDTSSLLTRDSRSGKAVFAGYQGEIGRNLLQASVRNDADSQFGSKTTELLAYGYRFAEGWLARGAFGTAYKAPTFNDLYAPYSSYYGYAYQGNANLKPETAYNGELAVSYRRAGYLASVTAFHNRIDNLIATTLDANGVHSPSNVNHAAVDGVTFAASATWAGFDLTATATAQNARDTDTGLRLAQRARMTAAFSASHPLGRATVGMEETLSGARYDDAANTVRLPGYAVTNLFVDYPLSKRWSANARISNLFASDYQTVSGYSSGGRGWFLGVRYQSE